ncbi:MAG: hypothetical protein LBD08_04365 [Treponema sp.]|jgi:hypothetical protein|nr:hypothetical protein [Treponema sp.]
MIDRRDLVTRHNPHYTEDNTDAPLSVGNGVFCFTADSTGLQTFFDEYAAAGFPLCTMAEWGWHAYPPRDGDEEGLRLTPYDTWGRAVYYATDDAGQEERFKRIRQSAHKFNLAKIAFEFEGRALALNADGYHSEGQTLNLWEAVLCSEFSINGNPVHVETFVHPGHDSVYIRAVSPLFTSGKLRITVQFPYGSHKKAASDFGSPERHLTRRAGDALIEREMDGTRCRVGIGGTGFQITANEQAHTVILEPRAAEIEVSFTFTPVSVPSLEGVAVFDRDALPHNTEPCKEARTVCKASWERYWNSGGALDFSPASDGRARELERRVVLSQYLIAIQSRGRLPPAETGLTCNSWYGKFHLEMHFWHHAHFALWNRIGELKKSLAYYTKILPCAREIAASQGYAGARWPKMCDPSGKNTPSSIAVLLIWQQPHPIMLAELCYGAAPCGEFLREYREVVVESAEFMKSFVHRDGGGYVLGPPYMPAQERHDPRTVLNAAYELEYFRWGFRKADEWLARLGEAPRYDEIAEKLALPAHRDGVYLAHGNCPDTFSRLPFYTDHPSMLAMYGILDSKKVEPEKMSATLDRVLAVWDKATFYGWDFPMLAMTACRLGRYEDAVNLLLLESPKNTYMPNGHNRMVGDNALPLYLPGNGGLLLAAAMLAAGYGGKTGPLFPKGFEALAEGINAYI